MEGGVKSQLTLHFTVVGALIAVVMSMLRSTAALVSLMDP